MQVTESQDNSETLNNLFQLYDLSFSNRNNGINEILKKRLSKRKSYLLNPQSPSFILGKIFKEISVESINNTFRIMYEESLNLNNLTCKIPDFYEFGENKFYCLWYEENYKDRLMIVLNCVQSSLSGVIRNTPSFLDDKSTSLVFLPDICKFRIIRLLRLSATKIVTNLIDNDRAISKKLNWTPYLTTLKVFCATLDIYKFYSKGDLHLHSIILNNTLISNRIYSLIVDLLKQLKEIHDLNLVHRDLKAENCILHEKNKSSWIDFEFSQINETDGKVCGSLGCLSPEILNGIFSKQPFKVDKRSDIYSLGLILMYLLKNLIDSDITQWFIKFTSLQLEKKIKEACLVAKNGYATLFEKHQSGPNYFILRLLEPDIESRPYIDETIELFHHHVPKF